MCGVGGGAGVLRGGGETLPGSECGPQSGEGRRENMACSWGQRGVDEFLEIHPPTPLRIAPMSLVRRGKARREVKERSRA